MTTFKVRDPDPKAVDGGSILGLRIEAFQRGKFIRPYYIFLNRPYIASGSRALRVHRHTVPPCIPLAALASRHLPPPPTGDGAELGKAKKQDLSVFARALRTEIANYHNRVACIAHLRKSFGLDAKEKDKGKGPERVMAEISAADAEAKQVRFEWVDGRIGRAVCDSKGRMLKAVVFGEGGRERAVEARMLGGDGRLEGLAERMR
jgi:central kinetochore subunit Mal2/MCM21